MADDDRLLPPLVPALAPPSVLLRRRGNPPPDDPDAVGCAELDEIIDFQRGRALFDAASQPKYHLFFPEGWHNDIVNNDAAARSVAAFFRAARAVPVI